MPATLTRNTSITLAMGEYPPVTIPRQAAESLSSFRKWAGDNELPDNAKLLYYRGEVIIEMGKEQIFTHVAVKTEMNRVLAGIAKSEKLGLFLSDGVLLTNEVAELSGNPDAVFVTRESFTSGQITLVEGSEGGFVEILGSADMVLEVVSDSSVKKDNQTLLRAYFEAGVLEYWLVDARKEEVDFHIYKRGPKSYIATRRQNDWVKSTVFGRSFRLVRGTDSIGHPEFTLEMK